VPFFSPPLLPLWRSRGTGGRRACRHTSAHLLTSALFGGSRACWSSCCSLAVSLRASRASNGGAPACAGAAELPGHQLGGGRPNRRVRRVPQPGATHICAQLPQASANAHTVVACAKCRLLAHRHLRGLTPTWRRLLSACAISSTRFALRRPRDLHLARRVHAPRTRQCVARQGLLMSPSAAAPAFSPVRQRRRGQKHRLRAACIRSCLCWEPGARQRLRDSCASEADVLRC
jgi:hypothetical protein